MTHRTLKLSAFDAYLACADDAADSKAEEARDREGRLRRFPHAVMLELAFPELDFAVRWCWQQFGAMDGDCTQRHSNYRVCLEDSAHRHVGTWTSHWFVKTDYDFGFAEFYFARQADRELFLAQLPEVNWGENFGSSPICVKRPLGS